MPKLDREIQYHEHVKFIRNQSHYDANSNGISAGVGVGSTGKAVGPGSVSDSGGGVPMALNDGGDQSSTTRSAIGAGTISIIDGTHQTQDVANLSRDTTNTNGTVSKTRLHDGTVYRGPIKDPRAPSIGVQVSVGSRKSQSQSSEDQTTQRGSNADRQLGGEYCIGSCGRGSWGYGGRRISFQREPVGLTPSVIQNTINNGVPTPSRGGTKVFYDSINNVSVVTNSEGKVVTVKYGK